MDLSKLSEWIGKATATGLLAGIVATGYLGMWIPGPQYATMVAERDEWKNIAVKALHLGEAVATPHVAGAAPAPRPVLGVSEARARVDALEAKAR